MLIKMTEKRKECPKETFEEDCSPKKQCGESLIKKVLQQLGDHVDDAMKRYLFLMVL
jgi:hypothetical protein